MNQEKLINFERDLENIIKMKFYANYEEMLEIFEASNSIELAERIIDAYGWNLGIYPSGDFEISEFLSSAILSKHSDHEIRMMIKKTMLFISECVYDDDSLESDENEGMILAIDYLQLLINHQICK